MSKMVLGPGTKVTVNGTDLSNHASSVTVEDTADNVEVTGFSENYREYTPGLKTAQVTVQFFQDYASGSVDDVVGGQYYANAVGTIKVTPDTSGTVVYTLVNKIYSFSPVAGGVGAANEMSAVFQNAGTAGLTRGTA